MDDLQSILADHKPRGRPTKDRLTKGEGGPVPTVSEIPDVFFDQILVEIKLTRIEALVLMYIYRSVWCRPNLYKMYGISPLLSHADVAKNLGISLEDLLHAVRKLEEYSLVVTVRAGQYFVRKYFLKEHDEIFGQTYDDFEV